ncbi:arginine--tRNA ligase related protein [Thermoplasma acidophilum]|uniref:Arginine--tRNA ligase n=1 Tax=Thermoplasma acidophilum (strain ATCC 25905 / DSM 1728 / JCM 9062 / NBRC 15155 / AMRC-C165) TaxID=273075 RepID=SYR_THEAC|nr:arginine--tRNA ligase [Thermoplasma acidophilum]Q9HLE7.1 RecName: Full=Arginine--tRNA ligase; AltName: Full=Arginyl-tRNA synthetase; Short=ArgRS [Thermoplasma acidophilum DSM 1728]MCY0851314.1 arginine--tRNA ligase [Thermoplasma acidophilum]CAC11426.1 arginine--tRNA ligase related protein [Thermoplasma acidophilum]
MLLFQDLRKDIYEIVSKRFRISENDVYLDDTGHSDITIRVFRILKSPDGGENAVMEIVRSISEKDYVEKALSEGGYINVWIKRTYMLREVLESIEKSGTYPDVFQEAERVSVEHTSANPTGPLHIGRARNSIIGDSIYRILSRYGYRTVRQYFVNDSGKQMISLYTAYIKYGGPITIENLLENYQKIYREMEKDQSIEKEIEKNIERYENADPEVFGTLRKIAGVMLDGIASTLKRIGIEFDEFDWESDLLLNGSVRKAIDMLETKEEDSARYIEISGKKVFLTRKDGTTLYFARDIAYHLFKAENSEWIIDVLGEDHKDHAKSLNHVLKEMLKLENRVSFMYYSFITLETGKMSTRRGNIVTLQDLVDRTYDEALKIVNEKRPDLSEEERKKIAEVIASSAVRYSIIRVSAPKPITFRWEEALNFESNSAPFIMYSHARAASILDKAPEPEQSYGMDMPKEEADLVKAMYVYPYYLKDAAQDLKPDLIAAYLISLVQKFNDFYGACRVIGTDPLTYARRIRIVKAYKQILSDAGDLIGIKMLDQM